VRLSRILSPARLWLGIGYPVRAGSKALGERVSLGFHCRLLLSRS
jgi:hypothetical protein